MNKALAALDELRAGNRRFTAGHFRRDESMSEDYRNSVVESQQPIAAILGCSDSRVPVDAIFDQRLGNLFVVRVAGNVVAASQVGSIEYAAQHLGLRLVVVLGHTRCGAVAATIEALTHSSEPGSPQLNSILERIRPAIDGLLATELSGDAEALSRAAVRSNVRFAANALRNGSHAIEELIRNDGLLVVGAEYALETGEVDFFDGVPP